MGAICGFRLAAVDDPGGRCMTDLYLASLRAIHVAAAVFWAGGTFVMAGFHEFIVDPGDDRRTLERMAGYAGVSQMIGVSGIVSVIAGSILYWEVSAGLDMDWIGHSYGTTITVGAIAGLLAIGVGIVLVGLTNNRVESMDESVDDDAHLSTEQSESLEAYRNRILLGERLVSILLLVAVLAMATAQYV